MAIIYDISTGNIVSENNGITTLDKYPELAEHHTALQQVQVEATPASTDPCDSYMTVIRKLLDEL